MVSAFPLEQGETQNMLESQELTPKSDEEGTTEENSVEPQAQTDYVGDIEPRERVSKIAQIQQEAEGEKRMKRIEYQLRNMKEENERLRKELGGDYSAPSKTEYTAPEEDYDPYSNKMKEMESIERESEIKEFVRENPEYNHLSKSLDKFAKHPAYKNIPVDFIAKALNYDRANKVAKEQDIRAREKAETTQTGGHPITKKENQSVDYSSMSHSEFETQLAKVKRGA